MGFEARGPEAHRSSTEVNELIEFGLAVAEYQDHEGLGVSFENPANSELWNRLSVRHLFGRARCPRSGWWFQYTDGCQTNIRAKLRAGDNPWPVEKHIRWVSNFDLSLVAKGCQDGIGSRHRHHIELLRDSDRSFAEKKLMYFSGSYTPELASLCAASASVALQERKYSPRTYPDGKLVAP